jgi:type IV pilus assembly protein PilW
MSARATPVRYGAVIAARAAQSGFTLIELLVALVLSLLIALAAVGALIASRQGFSGVEAASQLRDNSRFATELIQRVVVQAGFQPVASGALTRKDAVAFNSEDPEPDVSGANNSVVTDAAFPPNVTSDSRTAAACGATDTSCVNGSDVLILRYQGTGDASMINCAGVASPTIVTGSADRDWSMFHVQRSTDGEPTLMCTYFNRTTAAWVTQPLIKGVETFQVLYGADNVTPNTIPPVTATIDSVADRYLRADQMVVAGNASATRANWRRVRTLRVGLVLRGDVGSALDRSASARTAFLPLGSGMTHVSDFGSTFTAPTDGRLRQELTFSVHLRNPQGLE